jgi:acyl carrier protein
MSHHSSQEALALVCQVLGEYVDVTPEQVTLQTELASINVDSLTLAEMLFALEDRVGAPVPEPAQLPRRIGDLVDLIEPHIEGLRLKVKA